MIQGSGTRLPPLLSSAHPPPPPPLRSLTLHRFSTPHLSLQSPCTKLAMQKSSYYGWVKEYDRSGVVLVCVHGVVHMSLCDYLRQDWEWRELVTSYGGGHVSHSFTCWRTWLIKFSDCSCSFQSCSAITLFVLAVGLHVHLLVKIQLRLINSALKASEMLPRNNSMVLTRCVCNSTA